MGEDKQNIVRGRLRRIKRILVVGSVAGFAVLWGAAAHHVVGVTSRLGLQATSATSASSGYFEQEGDGFALGQSAPAAGPPISSTTMS